MLQVAYSQAFALLVAYVLGFLILFFSLLRRRRALRCALTRTKAIVLIGFSASDFFPEKLEKNPLFFGNKSKGSEKLEKLEKYFQKKSAKTHFLVRKIYPKRVQRSIFKPSRHTKKLGH